MSSKKTSRPSASLAIRLALTVASVSGAAIAITFVAVYILMVTAAHARIDNKLRHEVSEAVSLFSNYGLDEIQAGLTRLAHAEGTDVVLYRVFDRQGRVLAQSDVAAWPGTEAGAGALAVAENQPTFESVQGDTQHGEARVIYAAIEADMVLQVALRTPGEFQYIGDLRRLLFSAGVIATGLVIAVAWVIARRALAPLQAMTGTALKIAGGDFGARVRPTLRDAEFDQLAEAFNTMLDRIQALVRELRELNDSLAHDLRSVLARIHLAAERILALRPLNEEQESMAVSIVEESSNLLGMLNTVLDLSEMNTGVLKTSFADVDLSALATELHDFFEVTAKEKGVEMTAETGEGATVFGDRPRLRRALANLLDNAVKYTNRGGQIVLRVNCGAHAVSVSVEDTGMGIPPEEQPFIFDRFYRADKSRSSDGHGLGLSLTAAIVKLHCGQIDVRSREGSGSTFTITLPRAGREGSQLLCIPPEF